MAIVFRIKIFQSTLLIIGLCVIFAYSSCDQNSAQYNEKCFNNDYQQIFGET